MLQKPALFLDRDGTLIEDVGYPHRDEDLRILDGVFVALRRARKMGFLLVIVTNQSGVARGYFSEEVVERFHVKMRQVFAEEDISFDGIYSCPYHPTEGVGPYRIDSPLRKPQPGMLLQAAKDLQIDLPASFMIGDKLSDVAAGAGAGCRTILVRTGKAGKGEDLSVCPDFTVESLLDAVRLIESSSLNRSATGTCSEPN